MTTAFALVFEALWSSTSLPLARLWLQCKAGRAAWATRTRCAFSACLLMPLTLNCSPLALCKSDKKSDSNCIVVTGMPNLFVTIVPELEVLY